MKETLAALVAALGLAVTPAPAMERALEYGAPFGQVMLYTPVAEPRSVVLFISGDDGWNLGVLDMARHLAGQGAVVAGIDARRYLAAIAGTRGRCRYLAGDLEALGHRVQRELRLETYRVPLVYGFSSGASPTRLELRANRPLTA